MLRKSLEYYYEKATRARNWLYDNSYLKTESAGIPLLSIGNISCGGSGKTPLSMHLAKELKRLHYRPVLLAKGYKGAIRGPHQVTAQDNYISVGDEAYLMSRQGICPVVVSKNKTKGAHFIAHKGLGDIIVLDDGFQHRKLSRDLNILCIDASSNRSVEQFLNGKLLPLGPFREARDPALQRADIAVISFRKMIEGDFPVNSTLLSLIPKKVPLFFAAYEIGLGRSINDDAVLQPCEVIACCALANPEGFFSSLKQKGYQVIKTYVFPDHDPNLAQKILQAKKEHPRIPVLCSEKDAVKLSDHAARGVYYTPLQLTLRHDKQAPFVGTVLNLMQDNTPLADGVCRLIGKRKEALHLENVIIESERVVLKPVSEEYAEDIFREFTQEIVTYMMPRPARDISDTYAFLKLCHRRLYEGCDLTMMIIKKDSSEFLGCCGLHERNDVIHPELGIWVKKSAHGNKYGLEAVRALKEWAELNLRYEYLRYPVDKKNIASRKIAERLGGVVFKEKIESTMWGGILDEVIYKIPYPADSLK